MLVTPIRGFLDYSKQEDPPYAWVAPSERKQLVFCLLALTLTGQIMDPIDLDSTSILRNFFGVPTQTKAMHLSRNPLGPRCRIRSAETSSPWTEQLDNQVLGLPSRRQPLLELSSPHPISQSNKSPFNTDTRSIHSVPLENLPHTDLPLKTYKLSVSPKLICRLNNSRRKTSFHFLSEKGTRVGRWGRPVCLPHLNSGVKV